MQAMEYVLAWNMYELYSEQCILRHTILYLAEN